MQLIILTVKYFTLGIFLISILLVPAYSSTLPRPVYLKQKDFPVISDVDETLIKRTQAEDRLLFLPPTFPYKAPYGYFGSAIFCWILVGPIAPFAWNRACAGPVPAFRKPKAPASIESSAEEDNYDNKYK